MANGIGNNKKEKEKQIKKPAQQGDKSLVCVMGLAQTRNGLDVKGKPVRGCKEQIDNGEYVTIKLSDKPLQINKDKDEEQTH